MPTAMMISSLVTLNVRIERACKFTYVTYLTYVIYICYICTYM